METEIPTVLETAPEAWLSEVRYVSRQPILELNGKVHGYELLFRAGTSDVSHWDGDIAARTMLDNAVIFGLERFTNGLPAFVNCSNEALTEKLVQVLEPNQAVLAIPGTLEGTPRLLNACRELMARGFRLALDDFRWNGSLEPLLQSADYIRVDFNEFGAQEREHLKRRKCGSIAVVARNVETQEDYKQATARGFTLFQGAYICHPVLVTKRKVPANRLFHFEIVQELHHHPLDVRKLGKLILRDASLTYRLLRLVNSPIYAVRQELRSIETAIIILGDDTLRSVISLAVLSEMNSQQPTEVLRMALTRGRFCELAARECKMDAAEQYLVGMLSLVPAMLGVSMEEIMPSLPFRVEICNALKGISNPERSLLAWLELHERGDWAASDRIVITNGLSPETMMQCYADSVVWADAALRSAV
jgi:EAL and modified HD-GYP domain-containing signal transduction protein